MKRLRYLIPLLLPLILIALLSVWLVTTQSGLQALISVANRFAPVSISYQGLSGRLADFSAAKMLVRLEGATISVEKIKLDWSPVALFEKQLAVSGLQADLVSVRLTAQSSSTREEPFDIDKVALPLDIFIENLAIDVVELDGQELARAVVLQAALTQDRWEIRTFQADSGYGPVQLTASIQPEENWTHTLLIDVVDDQYGAVALKVQGDRDMTAGSLAAAALDATASVQITAPLDDAARWQLTAEIKDLSALQTSGHLRMTGEGDWEAGALTLDAAVEGISASIPELAFRRVDNAVDVTMRGRVYELPLSFKGRLTESELAGGILRIEEYRASPDLVLRDGQLNVSGKWTSLVFDMQAGGDFHGPLALRILATLQDFRQLTITSFESRVLSGKVEGSGAVNVPDSGVAAEIVLAFTDLSFVSIDPRLPAALSGRSTLQLDANGLIGRITDIVAVIPGNDVTVRGAGEFSLQDGELATAQFRLDAGTANEVTVRLADNRKDIDLGLKIQSLAAFVAGAAGAVRGNVTVNWQDISVRGTVAVADLAIPGVLSLSRADIEGTGTQSGSVLVVKGAGLTIGTQRVESFDVSMTGSTDAHRIVATAQLMNAEMANAQQLQISLDGMLKNRVWQFTIDDARFDYEGLTARLEAPVSGTLSATDRMLEPLCLLVGSEGKACASLSQTPEVFTASATVSLPPGPTGLEPWFVRFDLPAFRIEDGVEMQVDVRQRRGVIENMALSATVPRLVLPAPDGSAVEVTEISISATGDAATANYSASLQTAGGRLASSGELRNINSPQIRGNLLIDLPDLPALSALVSDLDIQQGALTGELSLLGPMSRPQITGTIDLSGLLLVWPSLGTRHEGQLRLVFAESESGTIEGELRSPEGNVKVTGDMHWQPTPAATLRLIGENFLIADTADLSIAASPDLTMLWEPRNYSLTGKILIDRAKSTLDLPALQNTVLISNDVVFVDDAEITSASDTENVTVDVTAEFKQPGKIDGRGINGEVDGRVRITQQPGRPALANGILRLTGTYRAFGQVLNIERGQLVYTNTSVDDPAISAYASRTVDDVTVGVRIEGRVAALTTRLESTPSMPESDILHYLVLGRPPGTATATENNQLSAAALSLALSHSEAGVQSLGDRIGVTDLGITQELGMLALAVGKQISPRLYVSYTVGLLAPVEIARMRYTLNRNLFLEAEVADESRAGVHYRIEKD